VLRRQLLFDNVCKMSPDALLLCLVIGITDGDTIKVRCKDGTKTQNIVVRLEQVDAPESKQPFGQRSRQQLSKLCFKQQAEVRLSGKVNYNRAVGEVSCQGQDVGAHLVVSGLAWAYGGFVKDNKLFEMQSTARAQRLGLWSSPNPIPPWDWRQGKRTP
jgi:endonuclease YncB( thermonuclease family)